MAPCNFWLLPKLNMPLQGSRSEDMEEIKINVTNHLLGIQNFEICFLHWNRVWNQKDPTVKGIKAPTQKVASFFPRHGSDFLVRPCTLHVISAHTTSVCPPVPHLQILIRQIQNITSIYCKIWKILSPVGHTSN